MNYEVKSHFPSELSKAEIKQCLTVIKEGMAVDFASAKEQLPHAKVVAVVRFGGAIVGVGAIKQKRPLYAFRIAKKSGFSFDKNIPELGYVARDKSHGGHNLSDKIVSKLLAAAPDDRLFATTSNEKMKESLKGAGFVQRGKEWPSKDNKPLSLWIRLPQSERSSGRK